MAELKPGWIWVRFGDVVRLNTDRCADPVAAGIERYVGLEHIEPEDLRIRRWGLVEEGTTFTNRFRPGQVLFGKRRAYQRKVAIADFEGICSSDIYVFEPKDERLLPELLPFLCQTEAFYEHAVGTSAGSLSPRTNWSQLANYEFALPPLEEQRRIAEVMDATYAVIESCREAALRLEICHSVILDAMVRQWESSGNSLQLAQVLRGSPDSGCSAVPRASPTGHWVLALSALSVQGYKAQELKPVDKTTSMMAALLRSGDLLISRSNTVDRVGFVGIYNGELEGAVSFPDTMMRVNVKQDVISNEFLELVLQSATVRRRIMSISAGTSASMKKINRGNLLQIEIPLPSLSEQNNAISLRCQLRHAGTSINQRLEQQSAMYAQLLTGLADRRQ